MRPLAVADQGYTHNSIRQQIVVIADLRRWQGDAAGLEHLARHAGCLATKNVTLAADRDFHLNEVIQIPDHVGPFQLPLLARQTVFQFLAQQQRQERAKYMPADRCVALVKNRPRIQQRFHRAEDIFDHPQLLVFQRHLARRQIHVRRQHPLAVVARFLLDFVLVNGELLASPWYFRYPLLPTSDLSPLPNASRSEATTASRSWRSFVALSSFTHTTYRRAPSTQTSFTFSGEGSSRSSLLGCTSA